MIYYCAVALLFINLFSVFSFIDIPSGVGRINGRCTGVLINKNTVLSAGHCLDNLSYAYFEPYSPKNLKWKIIANSVQKHESFDIGIVQVDESDLDESIQPIGIMSPKEEKKLFDIPGVSFPILFMSYPITHPGKIEIKERFVILNDGHNHSNEKYWTHASHSNPKNHSLERGKWLRSPDRGKNPSIDKKFESNTYIIIGQCKKAASNLDS